MPDPTPERVTLTEAERAQRTYEAVEGPMFSVPAVERILSDRLRTAQADAFDEGWTAAGDAYVAGLYAAHNHQPMPDSGDGPPNPYRGDND